MKKMPTSPLFTLVVLLLSVQLAACSAAPSISAIQTAVAGTQAAVPAQVVKETQVVEVTRLVKVPITVTPGEATSTSTPTLEATAQSTSTPVPTETSLPSLQDTPTGTPMVVATVKPGTPLGLTLPYFINSYIAMTDLQKLNYLPKLPGRTIFWTATVNNVTADGLILLKFPEPLVGTITLVGVPRETALKVNKEYWVDFSGVIQEFSEDLNLRLVITNVKISAIYLPPTLTPTPAPARYR